MKRLSRSGWLGWVACGFGLSVSGCGGAHTPPPQAALNVAVPAPLAAAAEPPLPPLTPAPAGTPSAIERIDLQRLVGGMTRGTNVALDAESVLRAAQFPGAAADAPLVFLGASDTNHALVAWQERAPLSAEQRKADARPNEQGWLPLSNPLCAHRAGKSGSVVACAASDTLLAFGHLLDENTRGLTNDHALELDLDVWHFWEQYGVPELRGSVPRRVDALLAPPALANNVPLRLAVDNLGFELSARLLEASQDFGRVHLALGYEADGGGRLDVSILPGSATLLGKAIGDARAVTAPKSLWQLPYATENALYFDSGLLRAVIGPSRRATSLLADAHGNGGAGLVADALGSTLAACLVPNRVVLFAAADTSPPKDRASKGAQTQVKPSVPDKPRPGAAKSSTPLAASTGPYSVLEVEDSDHACGSAVAALLKAYGAEAASTDAAARWVEQLKPGPGVPTADWVARLGSGQETQFSAAVSEPGALRIVSAGSLPALKAALAQLKSEPTRHHTLASRPELAELSRRQVLLGGLFGDAALLASATAVLSVAPAHQSDRRVPLLLERSGSGMSFTSHFEPDTLRHLGAELIEKMFERMDWGGSSDDTKKALARVNEGLCRLGSGDACNSVGARYADGHDVEKNPARARELLQLGCELEHGTSCLNLAFVGDASTTEQLTDFRKSCELDTAQGCAWYGVRLLESKKTEDHPEGVAKLEQSCQGGSGYGCWYVGVAYRQAMGVEQDDDKAAERQLRACQLGFGRGCVSLGNAYADGVGRKKNPGYALEAYKAGCKLDKRNGCYALGMAHLAGIGTDKDVPEARRELGISCEAGHAEACRVLAELTETP